MERFAECPQGKGHQSRIKARQILDENLVLIEMEKVSVSFKKSLYTGLPFSICQHCTTMIFFISICPKNLLSRPCIFYISHLRNSPTWYDDSISPDLDAQFDTSNYEPDNLQKFKLVNQGVTEVMQDESAGRTITHFVGIRPKLYSYIVLNEQCVPKAKGVKPNMLQYLRFGDYVDCLNQNSRVMGNQYHFRLCCHEVYLERVTKVALSSDDDKMFVGPDNVSTLPWNYNLLFKPVITRQNEFAVLFVLGLRISAYNTDACHVGIRTRQRWPESNGQHVCEKFSLQHRTSRTHESICGFTTLLSSNGLREPNDFEQKVPELPRSPYWRACQVSPVSYPGFLNLDSGFPRVSLPLLTQAPPYIKDGWHVRGRNGAAVVGIVGRVERRGFSEDLSFPLLLVVLSCTPLQCLHPALGGSRRSMRPARSVCSIPGRPLHSSPVGNTGAAYIKVHSGSSRFLDTVVCRRFSVVDSSLVFITCSVTQPMCRDTLGFAARSSMGYATGGLAVDEDQPLNWSSLPHIGGLNLSFAQQCTCQKKAMARTHAGIRPRNPRTVDWRAINCNTEVFRLTPNPARKHQLAHRNHETYFPGISFHDQNWRQSPRTAGSAPNPCVDHIAAVYLGPHSRTGPGLALGRPTQILVCAERDTQCKRAGLRSGRGCLSTARRNCLSRTSRSEGHHEYLSGLKQFLFGSTQRNTLHVEQRIPAILKPQSRKRHLFFCEVSRNLQPLDCPTHMYTTGHGEVMARPHASHSGELGWNPFEVTWSLTCEKRGGLFSEFSRFPTLAFRAALC
ncbi:hypothetical protein PR048_015959 [Dryococelus australis]|uniref:Uncharacterized protein n=1 Tax=Dryococelus australis TaxID=614101 RepID=A0ABQ9HIE6_9NEOP|nr:hypothetical protein PR048_015959 [Dryococelus australis]